MKKFSVIITMLLLLSVGLWGESSTAINPKFKSIVIAKKYKKSFNDKMLEFEKNGLSVFVHTIRKGEGELFVGDEYFEKMENYVLTGKPYHYMWSCHSRIVNIDDYKFIEYITLTEHEISNVTFDYSLYTTTPEYKICITIVPKKDLADIILEEASEYFRDSGTVYVGKNHPVWGDRVPAWKDTKMPKQFAKKLIAGNCESKTTQKIFNNIQDIVKSIKIK